MTTCRRCSPDWWGTSVSRIEPGVIELRGRPVQELIGSASLVSVIWLLIRGSLPAPAEEALLEAALVASVDHGPQAPSIAAARMAATCGVGLNTAMATGVGMLGDAHGGAGEQVVELLTEIGEAEQAETAWTPPPAGCSPPGRRGRGTCPGSGTASTRSTRGATRCFRWSPTPPGGVVAGRLPAGRAARSRPLRPRRCR